MAASRATQIRNASGTGCSQRPRRVVDRGHRVAEQLADRGDHARSPGSTSATHCSTVGSESIGTNALLRNVSGNTTTKPTPITASGVRTVSPMQVPIQIIAEANSRRSRNAQQARADVVWTPPADDQPGAEQRRRSTATMPASSAR